ncbi:MAG: CotH kinase family protein [Bacteroidales bacterium]|nr:CotH kinase family protein [Bacteroidales bacterium]
MKTGTVISLLLFFSAAAVSQTVPEVFINEFLSSNVSVNADMVDYDDYSDWIELYNDGNTEADISGFYITDSRNNPEKWQFPDNIRIPAKGFLRIWADGYDDIPGQIRYRSWQDKDGNDIPFITDYFHLNFKLSRAGEFIALYTAAGEVVDSLGYSLQYRDVSFGRWPDGAENWYYFGEPTPGTPNITRGVAEPVFSGNAEILPQSGFFDAGTTISMNSPVPGDTVFYTLDGSKPGTGSADYESELSREETVMVRASLFEAGKLPGTVSFRSVFINEDHALPVLSIITPPEALWDNFMGIYDNHLKGREIPVSIDYFPAGGQTALSMNAGLRLTGQASLYYPQISFTLTARDRYGADEFSYPFFADRKIASYKSLYLRNGGFPDNRDSYFRDALQAGLVINKIDLDVQAYQPAALFLNGGYWGIYNLREKIGADYLAALHHINPDDIDLIEYSSFSSTPVVMEGNVANYTLFYQYAETNDLSHPEAYQTMENWMDIDAFINYQICNIFYDNVYWQAENVRMWRERKAQGKWRWILFDNDWSFGLQPNPRSPGYENNTLKFATSTSNSAFNPPEWSTLIFRKLLENESFRTRFIQRFDVYLNSIFHPDTVIGTINRYQQGIGAEMPRHIERWKDEANYLTPPLPDYSTWLGKLELMREFARNRPDYQRQHLISYFGLEGTAVLELSLNDPAAGRVRINEAILFDQDYSGTWFRGVPIDLFAMPEAGYRFTGWEGASNDTLNGIRLVLDQDTVRITATFEPVKLSTVPEHITSDTTLTLSRSPWYATGDIVIDSNVTLTLEAGVNLFMPEKACIIVYGQFQVDGTEVKLVQISPWEYAGQWGAICFVNASDSSVIRNLRICKASRGHDFERDKAAISGFNSRFSLESITVLDSEDPIFVKYGKVIIRGCSLSLYRAGDLINVKQTRQITVEDCNLIGGDYYDSDAIDYDQLSNGIIRGNIISNFYGYNSDAIDLGVDSHGILIEDNVIANINDKGVSIGNGSEGIIRGNVFVNCGQGIGVKDNDSYGYAVHNTFYGNQYGVASFVKNIGEGGGTLDVINSIFADNRTSSVLVDELSRANVSFSLSNTGLPEGLFNMEDDPEFLNNLKLATGSPAIDAGNPFLPADPDGSVADLGAYPWSVSDQRSLIINEVHYHPTEGVNYQFIELFNAGSSPTDLKNYQLKGNIHFLFPDIRLAAGDYLIVAKSQSVYAGNGFQVFEWETGDLQLFPGQVLLLDDLGSTLDRVDYDNQYWWPTEPDGQGPSLELHSPRLENMASTSWRSSYSSGGTPGRSNNSLLIDGVYINEYLTSNQSVNADEHKEYDDWIELYNNNTEPVNLGGLYLTDNLANPRKHQIPMHDAEATTIPAKGYMLLWADGQPEQGILHLDFVLDRQGEEIGLAQLYESDIRYVDSLRYALQQRDTSRGRFPNGGNAWYSFTSPTPGAANILLDLTDNHRAPKGLNLLTNYPNPFTETTTIRYYLDEPGYAELNIYDFTGRKLRTLFRGEQLPGIHELTWNAGDLRPGIYYCELKTIRHRELRNLMLIKNDDEPYPVGNP